MKVLISWFSTSTGGAEYSTVDLCNGLSKKKGVSIVLLYISSFQGRHLLNRVDSKVKTYWFPANRTIYKFVSFIPLMVICLLEKPDIVTLHYRNIFNESLIIKLLRIKLVAIIRAILIDRRDAEEFRFITDIIGVSKAVVSFIRKLGYKGYTHVIYNGIDFKNFNNFRHQRVSKNNIYFMGRLVDWKRADWFIKSAFIIKKRFRKTNFFIFGDGPERRRLLALINFNKAGDFIHLLGDIDINDEILGKMGIFVMPSYAEAFGKTLIEAIVRGKVVVATDFASPRELLPTKELLFKRDDLDDLTAKIIKAYFSFDKYRKLYKKFGKQCLTNYNIDKMVDEYYKVYRLILNR